MSHSLGIESASRLCAALEAEGITHVFGLPGTQTVPLFEALRRSRLKLVLPSSELAAIRKRYAVSNAVRRSDGVHLRLVADEPPDPDASPLPPSLEDAYLHHITAGREAGEP